MMLLLLLQEKGSLHDMCPTCVKVLAWIAPYPSLYYSIDSIRVVAQF